MYALPSGCSHDLGWIRQARIHRGAAMLCETIWNKAFTDMQIVQHARHRLHPSSNLLFPTAILYIPRVLIFFQYSHLHIKYRNNLIAIICYVLGHPRPLGCQAKQPTWAIWVSVQLGPSSERRCHHVRWSKVDAEILGLHSARDGKSAGWQAVWRQPHQPSTWHLDTCLVTFSHTIGPHSGE